jgi:hypothetical protein
MDGGDIAVPLQLQQQVVTLAVTFRLRTHQTALLTFCTGTLGYPLDCLGDAPNCVGSTDA